MIRAILKKEWIKLRGFVFLISLVLIGVLGYFWYDLEYQFTTIEPESMMWYRFVHLEYKPYQSLFYLLGFFALFLATVQFVSERVRNRVRILSHLPLGFQKLLIVHFGVGLFFLFIFWLVTFLAVGSIFSFYYPIRLIDEVLYDFLGYLLVISFVYLGIASLIIQKSKLIGGVTFVLMLGVIWIIVKPDFTKEFTHYYIFYSPTSKEFVYQKNNGDHHFEYKTKQGKILTQNQYKASLPFVYWKDLDIQGKLPITIQNQSFDKTNIKKSRMSLEYRPKYLKNSDLKLFPFFNPISTDGVIPFPETALYVHDKRFEFYDFDTKFLKEETKRVNQLLKTYDVKFPIKNIYGKATNMKGFDLGYFFIDNHNQLFNIRQADDKISIKKINYPKDIHIAYIHISESKSQNIAGYIIDTNSNIYLLDWEFKLQNLKIDKFDYKNMRLQIIADPLYYLIRFNDKKNYHSIVYDKNYMVIDRLDLGI